MSLAMLFSLLLGALAAVAQPSPPCKPFAVASFTAQGLVADRSVTALATHLMVLGRNTTSQELFLFAIEYATGAVTAVPGLGPLANGIPPTPDARFVLARKPAGDARLYSTDPLGQSVLQLSPPNMQVDSSPIVISHDSSLVVFRESKQTALSGLWVSPVRTAGAAVRLSQDWQSNGTFSGVVISADNTRVAFLFKNSSDPSGVGQTIYVALLRGAPGNAVPLMSTAVPATALLFAPIGNQLAYVVGTGVSQSLFSVDAATDSGNTQLTSTTGVMVMQEFSDSGEFVLFEGQFPPQAFLSWYVARTGVAASEYVVSNNTELAVGGGANLLDGSTILVSVYRRDASESRAVWAKDVALPTLSDAIRLSPDVPWSPGLISIGATKQDFVVFSGSFSNPSDVDSYYIPAAGPAGAAVKVTPPGTQSVSNLIVIPTGQILVTVNSSASLLVTPGSSEQSAITRAGDTLRPPLRVQPNGVSALYQLSPSADFVATCVVPPVVVGAGQNASISAADGHVFVATGGKLAVATATTIAGSLVVSGGTLEVPCVAGTQVAASANLIIGSFDAVTAACAPGCVGTTNVASQTSTTLSVTVAVSCAPPDDRSAAGLSTGAIVGIAIGAVVFGVLVAFGVAFLRRFYVRQHMEEYRSEIKNEPHMMRHQTTQNNLVEDV
jgi:hypothetical protein